MAQTPEQRRFVRIASSSNQKARRLGTHGRVTGYDLYLVYEDSGGICTYCDVEIDPLFCSFDHVVPFDKGGVNQAHNIVACCRTCNRDKFTKSPEELIVWRELKMTCPVDGTVFRPRWSDYRRGQGRYCSRRCSGKIGGIMS